MSPASSRITSPGTRAAADIFFARPSRRTWACGEDIRLSSSKACWAWSSWVMEMTPLTRTIIRMIAPSNQSSPPLAARDRAAAPSSTRIIGSFNWPSTRASTEGFLGGSSWLGPSRSSRWALSRSVRPEGRLSSSFITCSKGRLCQSLICTTLLLSFSFSIALGLSIFWRILGEEKKRGWGIKIPRTRGSGVWVHSSCRFLSIKSRKSV